MAEGSRLYFLLWARNRGRPDHGSDRLPSLSAGRAMCAARSPVGAASATCRRSGTRVASEHLDFALAQQARSVLQCPVDEQEVSGVEREEVVGDS